MTEKTIATIAEIHEYLERTGKSHVYCDQCWVVDPFGGKLEAHIIETGLCMKCLEKKGE
jgi:hypothetical protein